LTAFSSAVNGVYHQFKNNPSRKRAYERGLEQRKNLAEENVHSPKTEPVQTYSLPPVTPEEDEAFEQITQTQSETRKVFDEIIEPVLQESQDESDEELDEMIEKSLQKAMRPIGAEFQFQPNLEEIQVNPRFEHQLEYISQNGHSKESIENKKQDFLDNLPVIKAPIPETFPHEFYMEEQESLLEPVHFKSTALANGKTLTIGTDANIFETSDKEFKLIARIRDLVNEFEEDKL